MTVLHRDALEASPLADLHAIASELGIDGYRRLRKGDLVDRILEHQGDEVATEVDAEPAGDDADAGVEDLVADAGVEDLVADVVDEAAEDPDARPRRRRGTRGGRGRATRDEGERERGRAPRDEADRDRGRAPRDEADR